MAQETSSESQILEYLNKLATQYNLVTPFDADTFLGLLSEPNNVEGLWQFLKTIGKENNCFFILYDCTIKTVGDIVTILECCSPKFKKPVITKAGPDKSLVGTFKYIKAIAPTFKIKTPLYLDSQWKDLTLYGNPPTRHFVGFNGFLRDIERTYDIRLAYQNALEIRTVRDFVLAVYRLSHNRTK